MFDETRCVVRFLPDAIACGMIAFPVPRRPRCVHHTRIFNTDFLFLFLCVSALEGMRCICLVSGGKDSILAALLASAAGHELVCVANLFPAEDGARTGTTESREAAETRLGELDSYCFQTVGHHAVEAQARCMRLPLRRAHISRDQRTCETLCYYPPQTATSASADIDEVEVMFQLLRACRDEFDGEAVVSGAVLSSYQRLRVESCCARLGLRSIAPLWQMSPDVLLQLLTDAAVDARLIKIASAGLVPSEDVGASVVGNAARLLKLAATHGLHAGGEGGEYESFVLDCPLFTEERLVFTAPNASLEAGDANDGSPVVVVTDANRFSPTAYLRFGVRFVVKTEDERLRAVAALARLKSLRRGVEAGFAESAADAEAALHAVRTATPNRPLLLEPVGTQLPDRAHTERARIGVRASDLGRSTTSPREQLQTTVAGDGDNAAAAAHQVRAISAALSADERRRCYFVMVHAPSISVFAAANAAYQEMWAAQRGAGPPARAFIAVSSLQEVVMDFYFYTEAAAPLCTSTENKDAPSSSDSSDSDEPPPAPFREALHVQSVSDWAMACIGPYSQANRVREGLAVAGTIGLVPFSMRLVATTSDVFTAADSATNPADFGKAAAAKQLAAELRLAAANIDAVMRAMKSSLEQATHLTVFVRRRDDAMLVAALWEHVLGFPFDGPDASARRRVRFVLVSALPAGANVELLVQDVSGATAPAMSIFDRPY